MTGKGPVFISGRQHSGNTVLAVLLSKIPGVYAQIDEGSFFEYRPLLDRITDRSVGASEVVRRARLEGEDLEGAKSHLETWWRARPDAGSLDAYLELMRWVAARAGCDRWAQKATSYIYYCEEILNEVPESSIVYMLRNPYDIAASKKRRHSRERLLSTMYGWAKGYRLAMSAARRFPGRFLIIRYEDLVQDPAATVRQLCAFLDEEFHPGLLDLPHVNRSETGYSLQGSGRGLSASRVYYYTEVLSEDEIAAIDVLGLRAGLRTLYPDLPHFSRSPSLETRARGLTLAALSPWRFAYHYYRRQRGDIAHMFVRTLRRLR